MPLESAFLLPPHQIIMICFLPLEITLHLLEFQVKEWHSLKCFCLDSFSTTVLRFYQAHSFSLLSSISLYGYTIYSILDIFWEKDIATHSSTLAWKIPWMEGPGRLQSMRSRSQTRPSDFTFTFHLHALEKEMATHSSVLAWRIPGTEEPGGLPSMASHRVGHD